jgi:hypothetical protein
LEKKQANTNQTASEGKFAGPVIVHLDPADPEAPITDCGNIIIGLINNIIDCMENVFSAQTTEFKR